MGRGLAWVGFRVGDWVFCLLACLLAGLLACCLASWLAGFLASLCLQETCGKHIAPCFGRLPSCQPPPIPPRSCPWPTSVRAYEPPKPMKEDTPYEKRKYQQIPLDVHHQINELQLAEAALFRWLPSDPEKKETPCLQHVVWARVGRDHFGQQGQLLGGGVAFRSAELVPGPAGAKEKATQSTANHLTVTCIHCPLAKQMSHFRGSKVPLAAI